MELTKTEFKVTAYFSCGYIAKEIADKLCKSYHTIIGHKKEIFRKNGYRNVTELAMNFVLQNGDPRKYLVNE